MLNTENGTHYVFHIKWSVPFQFIIQCFFLFGDFQTVVITMSSFRLLNDHIAYHHFDVDLHHFVNTYISIMQPVRYHCVVVIFFCGSKSALHNFCNGTKREAQNENQNWIHVDIAASKRHKSKTNSEQTNKM